MVPGWNCVIFETINNKHVITSIWVKVPPPPPSLPFGKVPCATHLISEWGSCGPFTHFVTARHASLTPKGRSERWCTKCQAKKKIVQQNFFRLQSYFKLVTRYIWKKVVEQGFFPASDFYHLKQESVDLTRIWEARVVRLLCMFIWSALCGGTYTLSIYWLLKDGLCLFLHLQK